MNLVGGPKCKVCGCDEITFLEFNHVNGGGAREVRENGNKAMMDILLTNKRKTDDLNILCRVCNALDHLARKDIVQSKRFSVKWK